MSCLIASTVSPMNNSIELVQKIDEEKPKRTTKKIVRDIRSSEIGIGIFGGIYSILRFSP